jgi:membrane-bound serine protease (ClpP class)
MNVLSPGNTLVAVSGRRLVLAALFLLLLPLAVFAQATAGASAASPAGPAGGWGAAAEWILNPWATVGLLVAGSLLLYHDLLTPDTWGVTGTLGVLCVGLVFAAEVTAGGAGWLGVILLLLGLAAVLLEIHVYPGRGSAIAGFMLMFAGMFLSLSVTRGAAFGLTITTILTVVFGLAFLAYLPKSPAWKRVVFQMQMQGALAAQTPLAAAAVPCEPSERIVGQTGRSLTALRPMGMAEIGGMKVEVVTEGEFLQPGTPLVVTQQENGRIVVDQQDAAVAAGVNSRAA